jgi:hypothetical protein
LLELLILAVEPVAVLEMLQVQATIMAQQAAQASFSSNTSPSPIIKSSKHQAHGLARQELLRSSI